MSRIYIANCTKQNQVVTWRLDYTAEGLEIPSTAYREPRSQHIRAGSQLSLGGDLHFLQVKAIIEQLNVYGLRDCTEAKRGDFGQGKVHYLCNLDQPVPVTLIRAAFDHNEKVMAGEGKARRQLAAVAAGAQLIKIALDTAEATGQSTGAGDLDVEIEQETFAGDETPVAEGFRLRAVGDGAPKAPVRRGRARRAA